ncbi:hypothetical protein GGX14DRAFT_383846 [Mycena pura]|uniref:Alpha-type protein kinase domain-containing protein n=1 Tax=Mycena pura TaxID=153505 RepID=A0AAD6YUJ2_9AGAR|nr:hypothetical protein GGX14DRAFT_383846 [Mycena pura]
MAEANFLYWATALLELCFAFIRHFIAQAGKQPPFSILKIRFVRAGIAAAKDSTTSNTSSLRRTYLLGEFINNPESEFVKFVHNGDTVPLLADDDPLYALAEFLCFTQHVQYTKSGGLIFISDYQVQHYTGTEHLLTDPQIMSAPEVKTKEGKNIFGEDNVGSAFMRFPTEHICNKYCKWFEPEPLHT